MQCNANIPQDSHSLCKNKIDLTLTSNLTLTLSPNTNPIPNPKPYFNGNRLGYAKNVKNN